MTRLQLFLLAGVCTLATLTVISCIYMYTLILHINRNTNVLYENQKAIIQKIKEDDNSIKIQLPEGVQFERSENSL